MTDIQTTINGTALLDATRLTNETREYVKASLAPNTHKAIKSDIKVFSEWCELNSLQQEDLTEIALANFLTSQTATKSSATIQRYYASLNKAYALGWLTVSPKDSELIRNTLKGIARAKGREPKRAKRPLLADMTKDVVAQIEKGTAKGKRDRALLLLAFASAMRVSELCALEVSDLETVEEGLRITIRQSKTDQEGQGQTIAIPASGNLFCPVRAVKEWLTFSRIDTGKVFQAVSKNGATRGSLSVVGAHTIYKARIKQAGYDEKEFACHSTRSGFLTSAAAKGASVFKMADVSRHKSMDTLKRYVRDAELFKDHAGQGLL